MIISKDQIVGELVASDYRAAGVFKKFGIDFCCRGSRSIADVCKKQNIEISELIQNLEEATAKVENNQNVDYQAWPLDLLADYIEKKHHRYVTAKIPEIKAYLDRICEVHGDHHPELWEVNSLFTGSANDLSQHMKKEEMILFPFIRKMVEIDGKINAPFGTVENPIEMMKHEHTAEGERFAKISELTDNYTPPADACNTFRVTYALLQEFEDNLHLHIHLENNILFPGAIEMEHAS